MMNDLGAGLAGRHDGRILREDFRHEPAEGLRGLAFVLKLAFFLNVFAVEDSDGVVMTLDVHISVGCWPAFRRACDDYLASFMMTKYVLPLSS